MLWLCVREVDRPVDHILAIESLSYTQDITKTSWNDELFGEEMDNALEFIIWFYSILIIVIVQLQDLISTPRGI